MRLTSLMRSLAPWHAAALWMWTTFVIVGISTAISHGLHSGVRGALAVLLAWAITRELSPRRAVASFLAPFLAVAFAIPADTDLLACVAVLLAARIATRSVGDPPTLLDGLFLVPFAAWAATRVAGFPVAIVLAAVIYSAAPPRRLRAVGGMALVAALVVGSLEGTLTFRFEWHDPRLAKQLLVALAAFAGLLLVAKPLPTNLRLRDDRRRGQLQGARIRAGRITVVAAVAAAIAWMGIDGAFELSSASAALVAAAFGGIGQRSGTISP
jgi:hypothetical protein